MRQHAAQPSRSERSRTSAQPEVHSQPHSLFLPLNRVAALKHAGIQYAIKTVELVEKSSPLQQAPLHEVLAMDSLRHSSGSTSSLTTLCTSSWYYPHATVRVESRAYRETLLQTHVRQTLLTCPLFASLFRSVARAPASPKWWRRPRCGRAVGGIG